MQRWGALTGLFKTLESLQSDCVRELRNDLDNAGQKLGSQLISIGPGVQRMMQDVIARDLSTAASRFQSWINQIMAAERKQIEQERQKLSHLTMTRNRLIQHNQALMTLQREAAKVSRGLCP